MKAFEETPKDSQSSQETRHPLSALTEEQKIQINKSFKEIKTPEDILVRAKMILRKNSDQN
jgi:hypothetical protein